MQPQGKRAVTPGSMKRARPPGGCLVSAALAAQPLPSDLAHRFPRWRRGGALLPTRAAAHAPCVRPGRHAATAAGELGPPAEVEGRSGFRSSEDGALFLAAGCVFTCRCPQVHAPRRVAPATPPSLPRPLAARRTRTWPRPRQACMLEPVCISGQTVGWPCRAHGCSRRQRQRQDERHWQRRQHLPSSPITVSAHRR